MFRSYKDLIRTPVKTNEESTTKYYCDLCDDGQQFRVWNTELDVEIHRRIAHKNQLIQLLREPKNYMCSVCLRQQADRASLISHIKTHHLLSPPDALRVKHELYICDYCHNIFFNKKLLIVHIKSFHLLSAKQKKSARIKCPACNRDIALKSIWFHFLYHKIVHPGTCPICINAFQDYNLVLKHIDNHQGYYWCSLCSYVANNDNLFQKHIKSHRKIVKLDRKVDVSSVSRFFVPQNRTSLWNRKFVNIFRGITLSSEIRICVLCRTMCETDEELLQHIHGDHSPDYIVENKSRHVCSCGEEFFNSVLLKHHVFTLKGDHRVFGGTEETNRIETQSSPDKIQRIFGIKVEIQAANEEETQNSEEESEMMSPKTEINEDIYENDKQNHEEYTSDGYETQINPQTQLIIPTSDINQPITKKNESKKTIKRTKDNSYQSVYKTDDTQASDRQIIMTTDGNNRHITIETINKKPKTYKKDNIHRRLSDEATLTPVDTDGQIILSTNINQEITSQNVKKTNTNEKEMVMEIDNCQPISFDSQNSAQIENREKPYINNLNNKIIKSANHIILNPNQIAFIPDNTNKITILDNRIIFNPNNGQNFATDNVTKNQIFIQNATIHHTDNKMVIETSNEGDMTSIQSIEPSKEFYDKVTGVQKVVMTPESNTGVREPIVYEVLQVPGDSNDAERIVVEDSIMFR